jgi:ribosomal protein S18 acetylase RimI-like enzyme
VLVRESTDADMADLLGLYVILEHLQRPWRVFADRDDPLSEATTRFDAAIADPDARLVVAEEPGHVVGMGLGRVAAVSTSSDERSLDLSHIVVLPECRGRGIGRMIVADLVAFGRDRGIRLVSLRVFAQNVGAAAFWSALGLRPRFVQMVGELEDL